MQPLVLLSNKLPLFIEINRSFNKQGWFLQNITDPEEVEELAEKEEIAGLLWDFTITDLNSSIKILKSLRNKISGPIIVLAPAKDKKDVLCFTTLILIASSLNHLNIPNWLLKLSNCFGFITSSLLEEKSIQLKKAPKKTLLNIMIL